MSHFLKSVFPRHQMLSKIHRAHSKSPNIFLTASCKVDMPGDLEADESEVLSHRDQIELQEAEAARQPPHGPGIRIVCISDTHARETNMRPLPFGDVLIHGGDFTNTGSKKNTEDFTSWMDAQPFKHKVFIAGNHDTSLHTSYYVDRGAERFHAGQKELSPADYSSVCRDIVHTCASTYLEDSSCTLEFPIESVDGGTIAPINHTFNVYGAPWQPEFCDWAFNLERGEECRAKWDLVPDSLDVLITHGPPHGYGDKTYPSNFRCGCEDLLRKIKGSPAPPRVHIFGHIHEDEGAWSDGKTLFVNATTCDYNYKPVNPPIVVHLPFDKSLPATIINNA